MTALVEDAPLDVLFDAVAAAIEAEDDGGLAWLFEEGLEAGRPDPPYTVSQWSDRNRVLASVASAEPGRWRTARTPYLREIMDSLSSYADVETVAVMKGAQLGVSEAGLNFIGYAIHHSPGPALYVMPTVETVKRLSKTRLDPMIAASPALSDRIKPARARDSGNTTFSKDFDGGTLILTGANSAAGLRSMPIRFLVLDEVDGYPASADEEGDPVTLAVKRTSTFVRRKIFMLSTPGLKGHSRIGKAFRQGDQRYYHVPCDGCGTLQPITWQSIRWEKGHPETAAFVCRECGHRHEEHRKTALMSEANGACWVPTATPTRPGYRSYHVSSLYSPWLTWEECVREFLGAKDDPALLQPFVNTVLGEEWEDIGGEKIDSAGLMAKREAYEGVPERAAILTAGVDVQGDRIEVEVIAWGRDEESWSVDYRILPGNPGELEVWDALDDFLSSRWAHPAFEGGMRIMAACVDTGGEHTQAAYRFVRPREGKRIWGIKGYAGKRPVWPRKPSRNNKGKINLYAIGVDAAKEVVMRRLEKVGPEVSGAGACHFPMDRDAEYFEQLTAERKRTRYVKGFAVSEWWKPDGARNEALDCRVYGYAALQGLVFAGLALNREAKRVEERLADWRRENGDAPVPQAAPEAVAESETRDEPKSGQGASARRKPKRKRGVVASPYM